MTRLQFFNHGGPSTKVSHHHTGGPEKDFLQMICWTLDQLPTRSHLRLSFGGHFLISKNWFCFFWACCSFGWLSQRRSWWQLACRQMAVFPCTLHHSFHAKMRNEQAHEQRRLLIEFSQACEPVEASIPEEQHVALVCSRFLCPQEPEFLIWSIL